MAQGHDATDDRTDVELTEYLAAHENEHASEPAKVTHRVDGRGVWNQDDYEALEEDPDEYRAECSCGETFESWGAAERHADDLGGTDR